MSSYIKLIIFIVVLLIISASIVFIDSSMDNINQSMPSISEGFNDANDKAISAGDNYNNSLKKLNDIKDKFNKDLNEVHKDYIDAAINELELKLRAVDELKESIYYLQNYYNYTGSTHGTQANELMYDAVEYQNQRNGIVQENPDLFN